MMLYCGTIDYWNTNDSAPNPCYKKRNCYIAATLITADGKYVDDTAPVFYIIDPNTVLGARVNINKQLLEAKTIGEVAKYYQQKFPLPLSAAMNGTRPSGTPSCFAMVWSPSFNFTVNLLPGSHCMASPPPYGQCNINEPNLTLDHSIRDQKSLNGNKASSILTVSCNQKTDLKMYIIADPTSRVKLAKGLTSQLTINSTLAATGI